MSIKINQLISENVKRVKAVKVEPWANGLTIIGGKKQPRENIGTGQHCLGPGGIVLSRQSLPGKGRLSRLISTSL